MNKSVCKQIKGLVAFAMLTNTTTVIWAATIQKRYYAHKVAEDRYGVIAPWYKGQNGQFDFRVRIAAETLKRYPWADASKAVAPAPEYFYNGRWQIAPD
ncbi:MAG: hypothetical protein JSV03_00910, partial [Planctomycetota bacterium]